MVAITPVTQCKMTAGFDADNNLTALHMRISGQSIQFALRPEGLIKRHGSLHVPGSRAPRAMPRSDIRSPIC